MGAQVFDVFHHAIIDAVQHAKAKKKPAPRTPAHPDDSGHQDDDDDDPSCDSGVTQPEEQPTHQGKLILDATVVEQAIRYPTDLSLLNEAREFTEQIIDTLYPKTQLKSKPRTYRQTARKNYLAIVKQRRPSAKARRRGLKQQLQYLRRNLGHIEQLLSHWPVGTPLPLPRWLLRRYWVLQCVYKQQLQMYRNNTRRCDARIVSISQPYVRPIVRGKQGKAVEFGAKLSVSLTDEGLARVDHLRWDAFHEGHDLKSQVQLYRERYGVYPHVVLGDPVYGTQDNRRYLKSHGIRFAGKPLGRRKKVTAQNREQLKQLEAQRRQDYLQRIPIEGKFGQGKNGYRLNYIRAKRADTSSAWINSIFLVMDLLILLRIFFARCKRRCALLLGSLLWLAHKLFRVRQQPPRINRASYLMAES